FARYEVRVPVRKVEVPPHVERHQDFAERAHAMRRDAAPDAPPPAVDIEFTSTLLAQYDIEGPDETYETAILAGQGAGTPADPDVDIYEMYWADLSRLTQSVFRIFAEIYQLLFHLGSLGVHAITAAQATETKIGTPDQWLGWARTQRLAADALSVVAVILN